jgi:RNA polymerase sigma-70 factor, ECF subfamily
LKQRQRDILDLLERDGPKLHRLLYRLTLREDAAEELLQDLVVRLAKSVEFVGATDKAAFAFRTAIHLAMDWRRRQRYRRTEDLVQEPAAGDGSAIEALEQREELEEVLSALQHVGKRPREVFVLRFVEDKTYEEIAAMTHVTLHGARSLCHRAVRQIREILSVGQARRELKHERD